MHTFLEYTVELGYLVLLKWIMVAKQICKPQARNRLIIILWRTCRWCLYLDAKSCIFTISWRISNLYSLSEVASLSFPFERIYCCCYFRFLPLVIKMTFFWNPNIIEEVWVPLKVCFGAGNLRHVERKILPATAATTAQPIEVVKNWR